MSRTCCWIGKLTFVMTLVFLTGCAVNEENGGQDQAGQDNGMETENNGANINEYNNKGDMEVAAKASERVTKLDEISTATVIVANRNAYVAAVMKNGGDGEVTDSVKTKISQEVKKTNENIQNVNVSTNPEFVNSMQDYAEQLEKGNPVSGMINEFNQMTQRVFPNNK